MTIDQIETLAGEVNQAYRANGGTGSILTAGCDGYDTWVDMSGLTLWHSANDARAFDARTQEHEDLEDFLRREIKRRVGELTKFLSLFQKSYRTDNQRRRFLVLDGASVGFGLDFTGQILQQYGDGLLESKLVSGDYVLAQPEQDANGRRCAEGGNVSIRKEYLREITQA